MSIQRIGFGYIVQSSTVQQITSNPWWFKYYAPLAPIMEHYMLHVKTERGSKATSVLSAISNLFIVIIIV